MPGRAAALAGVPPDRRRGGAPALLAQPVGRPRPAAPRAAAAAAPRAAGGERRGAPAGRGRGAASPLARYLARGDGPAPQPVARRARPGRRRRRSRRGGARSTRRAASRPSGSGSSDSGPASSSTATACASTRPAAVARRAAPLPRLRRGARDGRRGPRPAGRASCSTPRRATSGRSRSRSTRSCATRARTCCATCSRTSVYHYLIDRFGRVFRVVEEKDKANHAGHLGLERGRPRLPEPERRHDRASRSRRAGRAAGRCRSRAPSSRRGAASPTTCAHKWSIAPEMCVTHGLASVNPKKHLIGHHLDWARGFPFAAFGAARPVRRALAGRGPLRLRLRRAIPRRCWASRGRACAQAERQLAAEAAARGATVEDVRAERAASSTTAGSPSRPRTRRRPETSARRRASRGATASGG